MHLEVATSATESVMDRLAPHLSFSGHFVRTFLMYSEFKRALIIQFFSFFENSSSS